ncbi:radical SAM protein [Lachnoanaerobaculum umeaense]|uniref:Radical SAM protein n=1 Tax=Lachnoanaerobaculum umeaense TaxID=617123 RepID=A0A385Q2S5_9FIRM|nr:radical SAM protein [Lachnoanaerobaculum umeaense]AYA98863.1 radical SAM protein [Lachnoanaerobaculum umeaense]PZW94915.1 pyruvate formate lyase activating enzyme [Lachnoanaerobaculum umeaense]
MFGDILSISRLRMGTDGNGIATLVVFFDCPLYCEYCINDFCHKSQKPFVGVQNAVFTPQELIEILRKDDIYYLMSGGGVVFGGGEPLLQSKYIHKVCTMVDQRWAKRIETSLNVPWDNIKPVLYDMDEWIIDIKDINNDIYKSYTKTDNKNMIENLLKLRNKVSKDKIHIRIPKIPGYNTSYDIEYSVQWIRDNIGVEPEVFSYIKTINR